jgi:hypothetical protein
VPRNRLACALFLAGLVVPALAEDQDYELKVIDPGAATTRYNEEFPTEVEATARLWNQIKVNTLDEQTAALKVDYERFKTVRFQRHESLANKGQVTPEYYPALMTTPIRF